MAVEQLTTRRALIVAGAALPALAATLVHAEPPETEGQRQHRLERQFVEEMSKIHPRGRKTALRALRAGFFPEECTAAQFYRRGDPDDFVLHFLRERDGEKPRFGWVNQSTAFLHGPV